MQPRAEPELARAMPRQRKGRIKSKDYEPMLFKKPMEKLIWKNLDEMGDFAFRGWNLSLLSLFSLRNIWRNNSLLRTLSSYNLK